MKPTTTHLKLWKIATIAGLLFAGTANVQAEDLTYLLKRNSKVKVSSKSVEARRIPAFKRIERGFTPYIHEGRNGALYRHDEITSSVLAVHTRRFAGRLRRVYAGHSLAPNLAQIVSR